MANSGVDFDKLAFQLSSRIHKLDNVRDRIEKVAFDICRFKDDAPENLWQIHNSDDGDYIVALYEDTDEKIAVASASPWDVLVKNSELNIFYKKDYLAKMSASSLGFEEKDLNLAKRYLPNTLASNKQLVQKLFGTLDETVKSKFLAKYPELA